MNDDIKKFIDSTKLYTEVEVRKSEKLEEGFVDWVKGLAGLDDESVNAAVDNLLGDVTPEVEANIEKAAVAAQDELSATDTAQTGTDAQAGTKANSDTTPRPTENDEGDPYGIINARQQVDAGFVGAQARLDRGLAELKSDQEAWDKENPDADPESTGPTTRPNNRPADDTPKITAEIQAELEKRGLDKGIIGEPLTPEDIAALEQPVPATGTADELRPQTSPDADPESTAGPDDGTRGGQEPNREPTRPAAQEPNKTFDTLNDAYNADNLKDGDIITIDGIEAEVKDADGTDQQFFVHPGTLTPVDQPKPVAAQDELSATDTAQGIPRSSSEPGDATDDGGLTGNRPVISPLARKLGQITSASLMRDYNAGGKRPMDSVKQVQTALSRLGFDPNGLDGKYGAGTFKAVQDFQKANGLTVDGQVGPNTIKALQTAITDAANKTT